MGVLRRIDRDERQDRRRLLLDVDPLPLNFRRQLRQRDLHPVVDVDRIDVGIGAELERGGQRIAAVVTARALHVDHLVDADDLRLDRLRDGSVDHGGVGAGIHRRDRDLGRHDIGILRNRHRHIGQRAGDRGDDGDDDREARTVDENRGEHRSAPVGRWRKGCRAYRDARPQSLNSLDDDLLASRQPLLHNDAGSDRAHPA